MAQVMRLHLPSCSPGFESQAQHHTCFFQYILQLRCEYDENKTKRAGIKKNILCMQLITLNNSGFW